MTNRDNSKSESTAPSSSARRPQTRAVIHNTDDQPNEQQPSAAPPPRTANRSVGGIPELRMPKRDLTTPKSAVIYDAEDRKLTVRNLTAMDRLNMYEAAGPKMSGNQGWMNMVAVAISCVDIDGEQISKPMSALEMKAVVQLVGQDGLDAIQRVYSEVFGIGAEDGEDETDVKARNAKNS